MKSTDLGRMPDRELLAAVRLFNDGSTLAPADYALTAAQATALKGLLDGFEDDLDTHDAAQAAETAALNAKNQRRKTLLQLARQQMKLARAAAADDDAKLGKVNLDLYDKEPTSTAAPSSVPIAHIDYGKLKHTIYFRDSTMPDSEAKPDGVQGCEIWRYIGATAPASEKDYELVVMDTASPYVAFYGVADAGKNVFYFLRWISKTGETGGWGATINATING